MLDRRVASLLSAAAALLIACTALVVLSIALVACKLPGPDHPPTYDPTSCAEACTNARAKCGPTALTPRKGGTCEDVCRVTEEGGGDFRTGCLSATETCPAVEACSR